MMMKIRMIGVNEFPRIFMGYPSRGHTCIPIVGVQTMNAFNHPMPKCFECSWKPP
ncbi:hypothetical protein Scep_026052 [Stephania cephalantha]|uniref:Uncharacterized protein n=1 Tax=Stephania cephalantha TaxID=152367 RepID=A0AAP0ERM0_9MAGN